jgi:hypothetical protein
MQGKNGEISDVVSGTTAYLRNPEDNTPTLRRIAAADALIGTVSACRHDR